MGRLILWVPIKVPIKIFNFTLTSLYLVKFKLVGLNFKRLTPLTCMCMGIPKGRGIDHRVVPVW